MTPLSTRLLAALAVPVVLFAGLWLVSGRIAGGYWSSIVLGVLWFVAFSVLLGRLTKHRPDLRRVTRPVFLLAVALTAVGFWWTSVRETTVDEEVVVGIPATDLAESAGGGPGGDAEAPAASDDGRAEASAKPPPRRDVQVLAGTVEPTGHSARGRAAVVRLARGGHVLTLTDFDIDPGPGVEVWLVAGDDDAGEDRVVLGDLKGSRGDQQYEIPAEANLRRHRRVVFWCVPFSQSLARAQLRPS